MNARVILFAALVAAVALCPPVAQAAVASAANSQMARIKDVTSIEGVRDNQLIGYGLVVGLQNTGDSQQTVFPTQTLLSMLQRMGVNAGSNTGQIRIQNVAAVFVTATLPPYAEPGTKVDVTVSSAGDARSLEGGVLLLTPLYGADGKVYAAAQGALVLGGYSVASHGTSQQMNHPTTARIPEGGITEHAVVQDTQPRSTVTFLLAEADYSSAEATAAAINQELKGTRARALDSRRIEVQLTPGEDVPLLLSRLEMLPVPVFVQARVVVNERTGTVVIGGDVRLHPVSILHGGLSINVVTQYAVTPNYDGSSTVVPQSTVNAQDKPVNRIQLKEGSTVDDLVHGLQSIGATSRDVISILQAMKHAGALEADLEVI